MKLVGPKEIGRNATFIIYENIVKPSPSLF